MRITADTTTSTSSTSSPPSFSSPAGQGQHEQEQEGLRSLLGLVVDQVREMRRENERLHDTIAQLRATQDEMRLEAEQLRNTVAELRAETERRLARVEADHQHLHHHHHHHQTTLNSRQLELTRTELGKQKKKKKKKKKNINDHPSANTETPEAGAPTMPDVAQFIAQMLPFLRSSDYSSLILRDLRRPFLVLRKMEAETLDDMDTPIVAYASPSMCHLLGYDHCELHGVPVSLIVAVSPEVMLMCVERRLMRPPTPIGEPFFVSCSFTTKQGLSVPVLLRHQYLYSPRRLANWHITQVERVLATDLVAPTIKPTHNSAGNDDPGKRLRSSVHEPSLRAYLVARLPHSLLFGPRGELTTAAARPHPHHSFGDHHSGTAAEQQRAPPPSGLDVTTHERRAQGNDNDNDDDDELEELVRALGLPLHRGGSPASLAERWMRC